MSNGKPRDSQKERFWRSRRGSRDASVDAAARNARGKAAAGRKGGQSVPGSKRSFSQNRELAAQAGRKGGQSVPDEKRSFSQNPGLAAEAGRKGGQASHHSTSPPTTPEAEPIPIARKS